MTEQPREMPFVDDGLSRPIPLPGQGEDWRLLENGIEIPTEYYCDMPYITRTDDGAWLLTVTTGPGLEGQRGQHIISMRSTDEGRTWSDPVDIEPTGEREASYAVCLKAPSGRIYAFYSYNTNNVRQIKADSPPYPDGWCRRVDSVGDFVFKYTDDHGRSWSAERYPIPIRRTQIDRENVYGGDPNFFFNMGKAFALDGAPMSRSTRSAASATATTPAPRARCCVARTC